MISSTFVRKCDRRRCIFPSERPFVLEPYHHSSVIAQDGLRGALSAATQERFYCSDLHCGRESLIGLPSSSAHLRHTHLSLASFLSSFEESPAPAAAPANTYTITLHVGTTPPTASIYLYIYIYICIYVNA
jgi:hypothetical protein